MDDLISRQAAMELFKDDPAAVNELNNLASLPDRMTLELRWIPVTERLPKPNEYENNVRKYYLVQNEYRDMMVCSWDGCCWMQMYRNNQVEDKVVAWMPLPKPWEAKEGERYDVAEGD